MACLGATVEEGTVCLIHHYKEKIALRVVGVWWEFSWASGIWLAIAVICLRRRGWVTSIIIVNGFVVKLSSWWARLVLTGIYGAAILHFGRIEWSGCIITINHCSNL